MLCIYHLPHAYFTHLDIILLLSTVAFYQFVENIYAVRENVSTVQLSVELASSSGILLNDITLFVSTVGGSASCQLN